MRPQTTTPKKSRARFIRLSLAIWTLATTIFTGCHPIQPYYLHEDRDLSHYLDVATQIEYPDLDHVPLPDVVHSRTPITVANPKFDEFWELSLEEAISIALQNSKVLPTLGGVRQLGQAQANAPSRLSSAPDSVTTIYDVAIQEAGQSGVEQALANFDAVFRSTSNWDRSDRAQNFAQANLVNSPVLMQDVVTLNNEMSKLSADGTQWFLRNVSIYDAARNDLTRQTRAVPTNWFTAMEVEIRQPLFRGRGAQLNRIPVVLARMRTDVALTDFQEGMEQLLAEVEQAYWELYASYRDLDAAREGRDSALAAWQRVHALTDEPGGSKDRETQARGQLYTFNVALLESQRALQAVETRLRYLMGIAPTDGRFIRPTDEPCSSRIEFDWNEVNCEALLRSNELRRLRWRIKQRELELIAAKNQLLPQVDVIGLYRWLGVGDNFDSFNRRGIPFPQPGSTAVDSMLTGDFQEFRLAMNAELELGRRTALAQVRTQQLALVRERARLETSELEVVHQLTDAYQQIDAGYLIVQENLDRWIAFQAQVDAAEVAKDQTGFELFNLLDAQRQRAQAQRDYFQSLAAYNLAIMQLHRIKGSLMDYNSVLLQEGPWPEKAYFDAQNLARQRDASYFLDYGYTRPRIVGAGPVPQIPGGSQHRPSDATAIEPTPHGVNFGDDGIERQGPLQPVPQRNGTGSPRAPVEPPSDSLLPVPDHTTGIWLEERLTGVDFVAPHSGASGGSASELSLSNGAISVGFISSTDAPTKKITSPSVRAPETKSRPDTREPAPTPAATIGWRD